MTGKIHVKMSASGGNVTYNTTMTVTMDKKAQIKSTIPHEMISDSFLVSDVILAITQPCGVWSKYEKDNV
jgi:hypothetical protein